MKKRKISFKRILIIVFVCMGVLILTFGITGYVILHNYIDKINIVSTKASQTAYDFNLANEYENEQGTLIAMGNDSVQNDSGSVFTDLSEKETLELEKTLKKNMEDKSTPVMEDKNVFNILLIGTDIRNLDERGRSDAMIVISVNQKNKTITATSLMRDIYINIAGQKNNRLNTAYSYGGAELLMDTIEQNFKIKIDKYVSVDFYAFIDVVNAIGGVNIEVKENEIKVMNHTMDEVNKLLQDEKGADYFTETGTYLLNGKRALCYARNRFVGNCDFERTARQRRVLEQIINKFKGLNLLELNDLLNKVLPKVTTNLTEGELFSLILDVPKYMKYDLDQLRIPMDNSYRNIRVRGMEVLDIDYGKNREEIQNRIYLTE